MLITNLTNQDYWFGPLHLPAGNGQTLTVDDTSATSLYLTDDSVADAINTLYAATPQKITVSGQAAPFPRPTGAPQLLHGDGSPEGIVYAGQGSLYMRRDNTGGAQLYQKTTGIHLNTGWTAFAGAVVTTPTGAILPYGGPAAPTGWLLCDGSAVSRSTYADLFNAIGVSFGNGDGSTTFNLPDLRGRVAVGRAPSGGHPDVSTLGLTDGAALANRRPKHKHTHNLSISGGSHNHGISDPGHTHEGYVGSPNAAGGSSAFGWAIPSSNRSGSATTGIGISANTHTHPSGEFAGGIGPQTGAEPTDAGAYLVVNQIIKT